MKYQDYIDATKRRNEAMMGMYKKGVTIAEIARKYGVSRQRVAQVIHRLSSGIVVREIKIFDKKRGEISFKQKQQTHIRDNGQCQICFSDKYIQIHHRDKNRKNNANSNLIALCKECHRKLHAGLL